MSEDTGDPHGEAEVEVGMFGEDPDGEDYSDLPQTLIELIATRSEEVIALVDSVSTRILESGEAKARFTIRMAWLAVGVVIFIVLAAAILTYLEKIDGSTFAFLLGLVSGYMLNFVQDSMNPNRKA